MTICSEVTQLKDTVLHLLAASGTTDQTNYGNDGSYQGGMGTAEGTQGLEYVFDGVDDYIDTTAITYADSDRTVSLWVKADSDAPGGVILFGGQTPTDNDRFYFGANANGFISVGLGTSNYNAADDTAEKLGEYWRHVLVTYDASVDTVTIYVDGVSSGTKTNTATVSTSCDFFVGANNYHSDTGSYFTGSIKDVRVIDRILSSTEIRELYNATARPDITGTVLHLKPETGLVDQSAAGQANSTYVGDAGVVGRRFEFDGTGDGIDTGDSSTYDFGLTDFTVSVWADIDTGNRGILGTFTAVGGNQGWALYARVNGGLNLLVYGTAGASDTTKASDITGTGWHHLAGVFTRSGNDITVEFYVDGVSLGTSGPTTVGDISSTANLLIGNFAGVPNYDGSLDDIRIFSSALTAAEVLQLYEGVPGWEPSVAPRQLPGTVLHLEAATGERDQSYYGRNCTFNGTNIAADSSSDAFVFNGSDDYIDLGGAPLQGVDSFAVSLWLNPDSVSGNWIGKYSGFANPGTDVQMMIRNATQLFVKNVAGSISQANGAAITTGAWWHIVGVGDGTNITLYVNGVAGTPVALSGPYFPTTSDSWVVGNAHGTPTDGSIRDIRILNTALSADDVALLYNKGVANYRPPGLLGGEQLALMMSRHDVGVLPGTVLQLDGSTEYADQSGLGNDGTNSGTTISDGKFVFDGASKVTIPTVSFSGGRSVSLRVRFDSTPNAVLLGGTGTSYYPYIDASKVYIQSPAGYVTWTKALSSGVWYHIAITGDGTNATLYVDGVSQGSVLDKDAVVSTIGSYNDDTFPLDGSMDDIRIFNRALSAAEITTLYNNTIQDESGSGNHATLTNGAYVGESDEIIFDGVDDYVESPSSLVAGLAATTVAAWVKTSSAASGQSIISADNGVDRVFNLSAHQSSTGPRFSVVIGNVLKNAASTTAINDGEWHHVCGVYDGADVKLFIDGGLDTTLPSVTGAIDSDVTVLSIGRTGNSANYFDGSIRDARIFDRALSAAEVLALASEYEFAVPNTRGSVLGIVPSYFDTEADVTAIDWSGNGNAGVLTNGPTYTADVDEGGTRAIEFDGVNDRVALSSFTLSGDRSVVLWVQWTSAINDVILGGAANHYYPYIDSQARVFLRDGNGASATKWVNTGISNQDEWYHVTIIGDGTTATLYVNGVSQGDITDKSPTITSMGSYPSGTFVLGGLIDDVYIFPRALNLDEIKALASTRNYFNCPVAEANLFGDAIKIWMGLTH